MPFYPYRRWRRPRRYRRYWTRRISRRRPARYYRTRRARKTLRRAPRQRRYRKRRVRKIKRKLPYLKLKQWQPDSIRNCKIVGLFNLISFGQGRQAYNFIQHVKDYCDQNFAWGGGFCISVFSLSFLFEELQFYRNIWTASNDGYDLCRYLGTTVYFYRHKYCDYVVSYKRSPPMTINRFSYPSCHPLRLLLQKKKIIVHSLKSKPKGKMYVKKHIRPPKLMTSRWFFMEDLADTPLFMLQAAATSLNEPYLKNNTDNNCTGINILNPSVFTGVGFRATTFTTKKTIYYWDKTTQKMKRIQNLTYNSASWFWSPYLTGATPVYYNKSNPQKTETEVSQTTDPALSLDWQKIPLIQQLRYQPNRDTGKNNVIFIESIVTTTLDIPSNENYKLENLPLYLLVYGFVDYMVKLHKTDNIYDNWSIGIKSPFVQGFDFNFDTSQPFVPISTWFLNGKGEYGSPVVLASQSHWTPTTRRQLSVLNDITMGSPYAANPPGKGFDFAVKYVSRFKWGGNIVQYKHIVDPSKQGTYPIPSDNFNTVQIKDPKGQAIKTQYHPWDYRRGMLTSKAIKRALKDTDVTECSSTDSEEPTKKRRRAGEPEICLQEDLYSAQVQESSEEDSCQEETPEQQLFYLRQQQQRMQWQLLKYIGKLQKKQKYLSLLTGNIE
uniref:Capsid protein n=1 Tax=Samektorquevirus hominid16 TaxID=3160822 RepID=A0AAU7B8U3_9VIRU